MSLDADTLHPSQRYGYREENAGDGRHFEGRHAMHHEHSPRSPATSSVSSSNWASRRDSLATQTSQTSSTSTSATSCSPSVTSSVTMTDLGATLKQGLRIHCDQAASPEDQWRLQEKERASLVPSTPWASSLVQLPTRKGSMAGILECREGLPAKATNPISPPLPSKNTWSQASTPSTSQPTTPSVNHKSSLRSRLPKMGISYSRRPSDTPSHASSLTSHSMASSSPSSSSKLSGQSLTPSQPSTTRASLAAFSINKLRATRSTPLLRRKILSQLPAIGQVDPKSMPEEDVDAKTVSTRYQAADPGLVPPLVTPGYRKGSLPELPARFDNGIRRRASFLPTSMRRT